MVTEIIGRDSSRIQVLLNLLLLFSERFTSLWATVLLACFVESTARSAVDDASVDFRLQEVEEDFIEGEKERERSSWCS